MKNFLIFPLLLLIGLNLIACSTMEVPLPGKGKALFHDEFVQGHIGNWVLESDESGSTVIVPEQLMIELNA